MVNIEEDDPDGRHGLDLGGGDVPGRSGLASPPGLAWATIAAMRSLSNQSRVSLVPQPAEPGAGHKKNL